MQVAQPNRYEKIDFLGEGQVSANCAQTTVTRDHCAKLCINNRSTCAVASDEIILAFLFLVCDGIQSPRHSYRCHCGSEEN